MIGHGSKSGLGQKGKKGPFDIRKDGVVWLPEYAIFPYLFVKDDPKLPLDALTLDDFGSMVLLDVVESLANANERIY